MFRSRRLFFPELEIIERKGLVTAQDESTLDDVFKLPHIAGPVMGHEPFDSAGSQAGDVFAPHLRCSFAQEMVDQGGYVKHSLPQRRDDDEESLETKVKVLPEGPLHISKAFKIDGQSKGDTMLKESAKRPLVFVLVGVMLLTFCSAPPAEAVVFLVPAVVIGAVAVVGGIGIAIMNAMKSRYEERMTRQEKPSEQDKAGELKPAMAEPAPAQG